MIHYGHDNHNASTQCWRDVWIDINTRASGGQDWIRNPTVYAVTLESDEVTCPACIELMAVQVERSLEDMAGERVHYLPTTRNRMGAPCGVTDGAFSSKTYEVTCFECQRSMNIEGHAR